MSESNPSSSLINEYASDGVCRVLALDGGGAKGFYTLGVLKEIEAMLGCPLYKRFDLVFGTSTGAIIAALIALGYEVDQIHALYTTHVPRVMSSRSAAARTSALQDLAKDVFQDKTFEDVMTGIDRTIVHPYRSFRCLESCLISHVRGNERHWPTHSRRSRE